ncbi:hypothetical protein [Brevibacillus brevis]|uniref:hypothetical protein n=1 Tax=Brevibacillus brevis TaxID=1393 RepID=UPI00115807B7|nr:hypothetical protein [Lysinibacillus sp. SDF0063]TQR29395.1 hypothetical protein C7Y45_28775 [Lysinibacillus sp. SDF0063]
MTFFRFAPMLKKYKKPYLLIRPGTGEYDQDGVWQAVEPTRIPLRGHFQPVNAKLQQAEGGKYTEDDRALYTTNIHTPGDLIEYKGVQYTVDGPDNRDYCDVNKYLVKKVVANDPV